MVYKSKRIKQKQLWVDQEFISWLKRLKAKKELDGESISNLGELTRQLVNNPALIKPPTISITLKAKFSYSTSGIVSTISLPSPN